MSGHDSLSSVDNSRTYPTGWEHTIHRQYTIPPFTGNDHEGYHHPKERRWVLPFEFDDVYSLDCYNGSNVNRLHQPQTGAPKLANTQAIASQLKPPMLSPTAPSDGAAAGC
jgi:hypothetical protein